MKFFLVIFDILLAAYKKVCDISDKDTKWQEIALFVILVIITAALVYSLIWLSTSS